MPKKVKACAGRIIAGRAIAGEGGRAIAGEGGRAKGRKLSEYNLFVKANISGAKGSNQREKMSNVAKMRRERK